MGQCFSGDTASLRDFIQRPGTESIALKKDDIVRGLKIVADTLNKSKLDIKIIAVGGAINTVLLATRLTTSDVDFFGSDGATNKPLLSASEKAAKALGVDKGWLNNHTALFIPSGAFGALYAESVAANVIIFQAPGLTVYAAPWRYCLVTKIDRLTKANPRQYDLDDAVAYLHQIVSNAGGPVAVAVLKQWCTEFGCALPNDALVAKIKEAYQTAHARAGLV